jgi:hypothetical protein
VVRLHQYGQSLFISKVKTNTVLIFWDCHQPQVTEAMERQITVKEGLLYICLSDHLVTSVSSKDPGTLVRMQR